MDAPGVDRDGGVLERAHAAVSLRDALEDEQAHGAMRGGGDARRAYLLASVCPMISCAVKLMPQVGNELPTKKLSDWFE